MEYNTLIYSKPYRRAVPLRKLNKAIDRFCALHPRFGVPGLMRYIIGANVVIYLLSMFAQSGTLDFLALDTSAVFRGEIWRVVTYALIPSYSGIWIIFALLFYYWLGEALERLWGSAKFTIYYLSGVLLTAAAVLLAALISNTQYYVVGADYVNSALFFAYAMTYPDAMVQIMFIIPIKMKWLAWIEGALYALSVVSALVIGAWGAALIPVVALLNFFVFFAPDFQRKADQVRARNRPQAVQFRKAVYAQQKERGYNHKCCVCGKTDAEYPDMQFRYCSKCAGYHCFCEEHIFNHVHYTE